jgi:hypothetical protein
MFSMAVLAIIAARDLDQIFRKGIEEYRWRFLLSAATMIVIAAACLYMMANIAGDVPRLGHPVHFWGVWLGLLAAAAIGGRLQDERRTALFPAMLVCVAVLDVFGTFRSAAIVTVERRDLDGIEQWRRIDAGHDGNLDLTAKEGWRVLAAPEAKGDRATLTNTNLPRKVAVLAGYAPLENRFHLRWAEHPILSPIATGKERFWFAAQVAWVVPSDAAFDAFVRRTEQLGAPPLALHSRDALSRSPKPLEKTTTDPADVAAINALPAASQIPIVLEVYRPDELSFRVHCPTAGWLLVTDRWARGWHATVNGEVALIVGGDFIFRAIATREGRNDVRFTYHPFGFPWLLIVSWGSLAAVACWAVYGMYSRCTPLP